MKANRDLVQPVVPRPSGAAPQASLLRLIALAVAISALAAFSARLDHSSAANAAGQAGSVAYCVTMDGSPANAGLKTGLYTAGTDQLSRYAAGATDYNGCGVFNFVPVGQVFFISAWASDGEQVGNSVWFEAGAMTVAPTVQLDTPGFYNRLALH
jgi:hypothetical protein